MRRNVGIIGAKTERWILGELQLLCGTDQKSERKARLGVVKRGGGVCGFCGSLRRSTSAVAQSGSGLFTLHNPDIAHGQTTRYALTLTVQTGSGRSCKK